MTTIINGDSPSITFSDGTTQSTAALPLTGGTVTGGVNLATSSGNVGIGTTPSGWASSWKVIENQGGFFGSNSTASQLVSNNCYSNGTNWIYKNTAASTQYIQISGEHIWYGAASGTAGNAITFNERMRIDASNTLTSNATSNRYSYFKLSIAGTVGVNTYTDNVANAYFVIAGGSNGVFLANGGTSWTSNSDERLKDIIEPITDAVDKVSSLRSVIGKYKTDEKGTRRAFLIAQDVEKVLPEAVTKTASIQDDDNEYLGVQYTDVIPLLVASIKELKAELDATKAEVEALKAK